MTAEPKSPVVRLKDIFKEMTSGEPYNICLTKEYEGTKNSLSWFRWRLGKLK